MYIIINVDQHLFPSSIYFIFETMAQFFIYIYVKYSEQFLKALLDLCAIYLVCDTIYKWLNKCHIYPGNLGWSSTFRGNESKYVLNISKEHVVMFTDWIDYNFPQKRKWKTVCSWVLRSACWFSINRRYTCVTFEKMYVI